jgi:hypothetical protein
VATLVGKDTQSVSSRQVAGSQVRCRAAGDGTVLVDLEDWANARRVSLAKNLVEARFAFEHNGRLTVVPLGAKGFKSGSNWWSYGVPNCAVDGRWFVPLDALEARA